jgi:hypothetical protein
MNSLITTNEASCTHEIKSRNAIANVVFNKKKDSVATISIKNFPIGLHVMYRYFLDTPRITPALLLTNDSFLKNTQQKSGAVRLVDMTSFRRQFNLMPIGAQYKVGVLFLKKTL